MDKISEQPVAELSLKKGNGSWRYRSLSVHYHYLDSNPAPTRAGAPAYDSASGVARLGVANHLALGLVGSTKFRGWRGICEWPRALAPKDRRPLWTPEEKRVTLRRKS